MEKLKKIILSEVVTQGLEGYYDSFLTDRKAELSLMEKDLSSSNYDNIRKISHTWKGFCSPYGFNHLGELALVLEQSAIKSDFASCHEIMKEMALYLKLK